MSVSPLPDFERALQLSQGNLDEAELAESHGLLCGLICCQAAETVGDYLQHLAAMQLLVQPGETLAAVMTDLWEKTGKQFEDEDLGFELWLPDDDEPLEERTASLAQWCSGFLAGLGSSGQLQNLSDDAREAIEDLQQIARAELSPDSEDGQASEEEEQAYTEIVEYVRVVALTMREEFRGPASDEQIH